MAKKPGHKALSVRLLSAVKRAEGEPLSAGVLMKRLILPRSRKTEVRRALGDLIRAGKLVKIKGGYLVGDRAPTVIGRFIGNSNGFGFVVPEGEGEDVYIPRREVKGALHGDTVSINVVPGRDGRFSGSGLAVVERATTTLVGRLEQWRHRWRVIPLEDRIGRDVWLDGRARHQAHAGELVEVRITGYPDRGEPLTGSVVRSLGDGEDPQRDSEVMLAAAGVDPYFPASVAKSAEGLPWKVTEDRFEGREDLRDLPTVTIDGDNAKDFDDAVSLQPAANGGGTLFVHIADVDHFAPEGSALDREARERATSIYLPDRVVPMFPEPLSNGICSLKPRETRLAMTVEMAFNRIGRHTATRLYPSVIRSDARLTYNQVNQALVDGDPEERARLGDLFPMLTAMAKLAAKRRTIRDERGSLDFDLPEAMIVLGEGGEIREIVQQEREVSHRMIEEFMLAANEAVAEWLTEAKWPVAYRVHEDPDLERLNAFVPVARNLLGEAVPVPMFTEVPTPKELQQVLKKAQGHPGEHVLNGLLVRSLKQARYTGEALRHYGLASPCYCHFTSPIRRYPDLMVHRLVKARLAGAEVSHLPWVSSLEAIVQHSSERERRAVGLERKVVEMKKCRFLAHRVGDIFDGVVSSVARFGLFVNLAEVDLEGLVHTETLPGPVVHDERHMVLLLGPGGRQVAVGERVRVQIQHVDVLAAKVSLDLLDDIPDEGGENDEHPPPHDPPGEELNG